MRKRFVTLINISIGGDFRRTKNSTDMQSGQSLFEVVFAIAVVAIIISGVVALSATTVRNSSFSRNNALATNYAQEAAEWLRSERDNNWVIFSGRSNTSGVTWCINALTWVSGVCSGNISGTIFMRTVTLTTDIVDPNTIQAVVLAIWADSQGNHQTKTTMTLTNWKNQ